MVPTEEKIEGAVKHILRNRSRGASGMRNEYLKRWIAAEKKRKRGRKRKGKGRRRARKGDRRSPTGRS